MAKITEAHAAHYREHGYAVVDNFLREEELTGALDDLREVLPGWVEYCEDPTRPAPVFPSQSRASTTVFPYRGDRLNAITMHPELRRFAAENVGHGDIFCEQSHLHAKYRGSDLDRDQAMHCDFANHTLAYPPDLPEYWQTAYLVYYTEVTAELAPTAVCSWRHYPEKIRWPGVYRRREERPEIFDNERRIIVPAGSLFIYSMRTFHRGTTFKADGGRIAQFITYAPAAWKWLGIVGWSAHGVKPEFRRWMERATPAERELLGFPPPKHPYWTEETIAGVSARYPGMDMAPYRA